MTHLRHAAMLRADRRAWCPEKGTPPLFPQPRVGWPTCAAAAVSPALPTQDQGERGQQDNDEAGQCQHQQEPPLGVERGVRLG